MNKKLKNVLNIILDIFMVLFLVFAAFTLVISLSQKAQKVGGEPSQIFGYSIRSVQSESMEPYNADGSKYDADNAFYKGDIIISKVTDDDETYEIGDAVMFWMFVTSTGEQTEENSSFTQEILVTHQIVDIEVQDDGTTVYWTQGLNKMTNPERDAVAKTADEFVAKYSGKRIGGIGNVITFIQGGFKGLKTGLQETDGWGFFLCIVLPILIFVIIQAIRVIRNIIAYKAQKTAVAVASGELSEEQKRLIAEEYLKQQTANDSNATPSTDATPADEEANVEEETPADDTDSSDEASTADDE